MRKINQIYGKMDSNYISDHKSTDFHSSFWGSKWPNLGECYSRLFEVWSVWATLMHKYRYLEAQISWSWTEECPLVEQLTIVRYASQSTEIASIWTVVFYHVVHWQYMERVLVCGKSHLRGSMVHWCYRSGQHRVCLQGCGKSDYLWDLY